VLFETARVIQQPHLVSVFMYVWIVKFNSADRSTVYKASHYHTLYRPCAQERFKCFDVCVRAC